MNVCMYSYVFVSSLGGSDSTHSLYSSYNILLNLIRLIFKNVPRLFRFALVHAGYLVNPFLALASVDSYQKYIIDTITGSIGGTRSSQLRYHWNGVQSASECRCGVQGESRLKR